MVDRYLEKVYAGVLGMNIGNAIALTIGALP